MFSTLPAVCVCVCVFARERACVYVCEGGREKRESVCVCEGGRERLKPQNRYDDNVDVAHS